MEYSVVPGQPAHVGERGVFEASPIPVSNEPVSERNQRESRG